jgi:hypothetical protein
MIMQPNQNQPKSQSEIDTILRGVKWNSQSEANTGLQKYGYRAVLNENNTAEIFDESSSKKVATIQFDTASKHQISGITY